MAPNDLSYRAERAVAKRPRSAIAHGELRPDHRGDYRRDARHWVGPPVERGKRSTQVHVAATLGIDRQSDGGSSADRIEHGLIRGQFGREQLWEAATEIEPGEIRRHRTVGERRKRHQLRSRLLEQVERIFVVEGEG